MTASELPAPRNVDEALSWGRRYLAGAGLEGAALDAHLLLGHSLGLTKEQVVVRSGDRLEGDGFHRYRLALEERARRIPLAHITGSREFWSLPLRVDSRVLVPRPETEDVVEAALERLPARCRVLDVGTGSGCITAALASSVKEGEFLALDISGDALGVARENVRRLGLERQVSLLRSDLFGGLRRGGDFDAVLSNPPYIPTGELAGLQPEVGSWEPEVALDGGRDGLDLIRRLVGEAHGYLRSGGFLAVEVGAGQDGTVSELMAACGKYGNPEVRSDLAGIGRVVVAERL